MLVLTRKKGQSIMIGDDIEVKVIEVDGEAVRIGIKAPRELSIYRQEIYEAIREENIRAASRISQVVDKLKEVQPADRVEDNNGRKDSH